MQSQALSQSVQVADIIDRCRFRGLPLVVSFFTVLTFVFDGFDIQGVAFVAPELLKQWGITRGRWGPCSPPVWSAWLQARSCSARSAIASVVAPQWRARS
jgi:hypothetical protein